MNILEGKVAVITGAGSGVGAAAVRIFCANGAKVIAADIDEDAAKATAAKVGQLGGEVRAVVCDVADKASLEAAVAATVEAFGRIDIMYNNAGITVMPDEEMRRVEDVNINGVIFGCQTAISQFQRQGGGGAIVNTASVAGLMGYGGVLYGATKGAVVNLTRALAIEVADHDIRVNSVCPAGMLTRYSGMDPDSEHADIIKEKMGAAHPLGRSIEPEDTANAAMFLCSELASSITGVNLPVDGGLTAGRKIGK